MAKWIEYLLKAWELHLSVFGDPVAFREAWELHSSGFVSPIVFIHEQA
jgi:hypothetical protein